jgi:subtilisin family serine protease
MTAKAAFVIVVLAAALPVVGFGVSGDRERSLVSQASSWRGLVGGARATVTVGQRALVVLNAPSLAQRLAARGGLATEAQERRWTKAAIASQKRLLLELSTHGVNPRVEFSFARVLNGFSAPLDARAAALLERRPEVAGVYPVRVAFPASTSSELLRQQENLRGAARPPVVSLPGYRGRGVTVALLDTGVDARQPYLRGRLLSGINVLDDGRLGTPAAADPADPSRRERHGTELAGILAGAHGPAGIAGVATGASVLPIRVAGWQPDQAGGWAVYARSDQVIEGLERAVDPNVDGDAHDAARIALVGVAASYGAFADSPEARAVRGALQLDTLVVAPAGNDGPGGPAYGSVASPGGAPAALTVGAADLRTRGQVVRVALRTGLDLLLDRREPLVGAAGPARPVELELASPRRGANGEQVGDFFERGISLVAGRAALIRAGADPQLAVEYAAQAGASAVVFYGTQLAAGGLGLDASVAVPVLSLPQRVGRLALAAIDRHERPALSIGMPEAARNGADGQIAAFSSRGLAFDGRVKPDVVAPGVALPTSEPGVDDDGSPSFGTVNGSSAAAAVVAGAAAALAQARPQLSGADLKSVLAGTARTLPDTSVAAQGGGLVDVGAAAAAEMATTPDTLAFGRAQGDGWQATQRLTLRNVSSRRLLVRVRTPGRGGLLISAKPRHVRLRPGGEVTVRLQAHLRGAPPESGSAEGTVLVVAHGAGPLRVPWAITFGRPAHSLISSVRLSASSLKPSDTTPAVLSLRAGSLVQAPTGPQVEPLARLDVELWRGRKRIGLLARLRDLLPGRVAIGLTGRGPGGNRLGRGNYRIRLIAVPTSGLVTRKSIVFRIE